MITIHYCVCLPPWIPFVSLKLRDLFNFDHCVGVAFTSKKKKKKKKTQISCEPHEMSEKLQEIGFHMTFHVTKKSWENET